LINAAAFDRAAVRAHGEAQMRQFHNVNMFTYHIQPDEIDVPETRVFVTNPADHPDRIEDLWFEPDSPLTGPVREQPHIASRVDDLDAEVAGSTSCSVPSVPWKACALPSS
jgi:hypothetical protein